jgi:hypothetical protein
MANQLFLIDTYVYCKKRDYLLAILKYFPCACLASKPAAINRLICIYVATLLISLFKLAFDGVVAMRKFFDGYPKIIKPW